MSNPFLDAINGTQAKPAAPTPQPQQKASSGNPFLDAINGGSQPKAAPQVTQSKATPVAKPTQFTAPSGGIKIGENKWKTPSGSIWEYKPDGTRVITMAPQFGGGSYLVNPSNVNQVIDQGKKVYGGEDEVKGQQRDHIVPQGLGGLNSPTDNSNIRMENLIKGNSTSTDPIEKQAINDYKSGKISLAQARLKVMTTKQDQTNGAPKVGTANNFGSGLLQTGKDLLSATASSKLDTQKQLTQPNTSRGMEFPVSSRDSAILNTKEAYQSQQLNQFKADNKSGSPLPTFEEAKSMVRAPIRGIVQITNPSGVIEPVEKGKLFRLIYGDEPLTGYSRQAADAEQGYKDRGFGKLSTPLAVLQTTGSASLDLLPLYAPVISSINEELASVAKNSGTKAVKVTFKDLQTITSKTPEESIKILGKEKYDAITKVGQTTRAGNVINVTNDTLLGRATKPISEILQPTESTYSLQGAPSSAKIVQPDVAPKEVTIPQKNYQLVEAPKTSYEPVTTPLPPHMEVRTPEVISHNIEDTTIRSQKTIDAIKNSQNQKGIGNYGNTKFELGSFGQNQVANKAGSADRFPITELSDTIKNIKNVYKASDNPKSYRIDNKAWVSEMSNGEKRVIYTHKNANGAEEVINWHKVNETKNPNYLSTLESYGSPAGTRTQIGSLEGRSPVQLKDKTDISIAENTVNVKSDSKIAKSVETKAIETGLTKGYEGVAGYDKLTIADQAERASKLFKNPEQAMRVIKGEDTLPEGLRGTAVITAAEEHIKRTGDARMAYELANSPLASETSAAAQELRLAAEREPDSVAAKLHDLKKTKEKVVKKRYGSVKKAKSEIKSSIKKELQKVAPKPKDWAEFIDSLKC